MAKKEILIFTREITTALNDISKSPNYEVIKHFIANEENCDCTYPRITAFVTADKKLIDIEELIWFGEFSSTDKCEEFFIDLLNSYWRFAIRNRFHCILSTISS